MTKDMAAPTDNGELGRRVRAARNSAGLTLEQVSTRIGVSPATLSLIERDKVSITVDRLTDIAAALDIELDALVSGSAVPAGGGSRADSRHDDTLPKVLEAAITCFNRWGYHGTSMRQIAQEAGVSVAGVYHYYESKQQMLVAILDTTMSNLIEGVEGVRAKVADRPPEERFSAVVEALAYYHATARSKAFIGASEMRSVEEPHRTRITELRRSVQHVIDEEAAAGVESGVFSVPDLKIASRVVANMCTSLAQWYDPSGPVSPGTAAADVADYAVAIMQVGPRRSG